jgi:prevent-host-death family protein
MRTVNIHDAKTNLSRLVAEAVRGEPFVIAKAGRPLVKVVRIEVADVKPRRLGFLAGAFSVPDDFDRMNEGEIEAMFSGNE